MSMPFLKQLGIGELSLPICTGAAQYGDDSDGTLESYSPADGSLIGSIGKAKTSDYERVIETAGEAFKQWRKETESQWDWLYLTDTTNMKSMTRNYFLQKK